MNLNSRFLEIRPWPFPYLAGMAFSNDADAMEFNFFDEFMGFLNSKTETKFGLGLGLEITSSVFFFAPKTDLTSIFMGLDPNASESINAARLKEYIKAGWIDAIHAYGDFDSFPVFTRAHSIRVFDFLSALGKRIHIFSNHGSKDNIQNLGLDAPYHQGDQISSDAYHADLCRMNGVEFLWTDSMTYHNPGKAKILDRLIAQIRSITTLRSYPRYFDARDKEDVKVMILADKSSYLGFRRFGGLSISPNLSLVSDQIKHLILSKMYDEKKGVVIYQHFGVIFQNEVECRPSTIEEVLDRRKELLEPFVLLKNESDSGRLWVVGLYRFLKYLVMRDSINIIQLVDGDFQAKAKEVKALQAIENCDFSGLTFYSDYPGPAELIVGNYRLPLTSNPPDGTGKGSFSIPIQPLNQIW